MSHKLLGRAPIWHLNECHLETSPTGVLHSRYAVSIVCNERDQIDCSIGGVVRDVKTNTHVHALLLKVRLEVGIGRSSSPDRNNWRLLRDEAPELQYTAAHGYQILPRACYELGGVASARWSMRYAKAR